MLIKTYNKLGEEVGQTRLPAEIFGVKTNPDLIRQIVISQTANRRIVIAHTKDRSEVSGGGRKPWRQKGTGRARHGSIRSPLWYHGGVTFGPTKERNFKKEIPQKMRRLALFMVLSEKAKNSLLILLDELKIEKAKTKLMAQIIGNLESKIPALRIKEGNSKGGSYLLALAGLDKKIILAARNIEGLKTIQTKDLSALDLLSFKYLIMPKDSLGIIKETFLKGNK